MRIFRLIGLMSALVISINWTKSNAQEITLGTGTSTTTVAQTTPTSVNARYARIQVVYTASEINAAGITGTRPIAALSFNVAVAASVAHKNYKVTLAHTSATNSASFVNGTDAMVVYQKASQQFNTVGWIALTFDNPFIWNGTDNILVDICWGDNVSNGTGGSVVIYSGTTTAGLSSSTSNSINRCNFTTLAPANVKPQAKLLFPSLNPDLGATAIVSPSASGCFGGVYSAKVAIRNLGTQTAYFSAQPLTAGIRIGADVVQSTVSTGILAPNDTIHVNVGNINASVAGAYVLKAFSAITGDTVTSNDTLAANYTSYGAPQTLPVTANFTGFTGSNLATIHPGWREAVGTPAGGVSGTSSLWSFDGFANGAGGTTSPENSIRNSYSTATDDEWFISPTVSITTSSKLSFDLALTLTSGNSQATFGSDDKFEVYASTDCGITWQLLKSYGNTTVISPFGQKEEIPLDAFMGQNIQLGFYATEGNIDDPESVYLFVDNVSIKENAPFDIAIEQVIEPQLVQCNSASDPVIISVKNTGTSTLDFSVNPVLVNCLVSGAATSSLTTSLTTGTLAPNAITQVNIGNVDMSAIGSYNFTIKLTLAPDADTTNNITTFSRNGVPPVVPSQATDFTGFTGSNLGVVFFGWNEARGQGFPAGTASNWTSTNFTNLTGHPNGTAAYITLDAASDREWILSPRIIASAATRLSYDYALTDGTTGQIQSKLATDDTVQVLISTNCGASFMPLITYDSSSNILPTTQSNVLNLSAYAGKQVLVGFYASEGTFNDPTTNRFWFDNLNIFNTTELDLTPSGIVSPTNMACISASHPVTVKIQNLGTSTIDFSTSPATVQVIINGVTPETLSVSVSTGSLAPLAELNVNLGNGNFSTSGTYSFTATVTMAGDGDAANNTSSLGSVDVVLPVANAFTDFTGYSGSDLATDFPGWNEAKGQGKPNIVSANWFSTNFTNLTGHPNGTAAYVTFDAASDREWILSPKILATATTALSYDYALTNGTSGQLPGKLGNDDSLIVMVSTDCGNTFMPLHHYDSGSNILPQTQTHFTILSSYAGQEIIIGFYATEGTFDDLGSRRIFLDNIRIYNASPIDISVGANLIDPDPTKGCIAPNNLVKILLSNKGVVPYDFTNNPATVRAIVTGGSTPDTIVGIVNSGVMAVNADTVVTVGVGNFAIASNYTVSVVVNVTGDGDVANNSVVYSNVNVLKTEALPQQVDFTGFTGSNLTTMFPLWREGSGIASPVGTTSNWTSGSFANNSSHPNGACIRLYLYGSNLRNDWVVGPKFTASTNTLLRYEISQGLLSGNGQTPMGSDDKVAVMVSTNCGATFTEIKTYNSASVISNTGQVDSVSLSAFAGQDIIVAFYGTDGSVDDPISYYFYLDNIDIRNVVPRDVNPSAFVKPLLTNDGCFGVADSVVVKIRSNGTTPLNLATTPVTITFIAEGAGTTTLTKTVNSGILTDGAELDVFMGLADFSAYGIYNIKAITQLSGDAYSLNDTLTSVLNNKDGLALPVAVNFNGFTGSNLAATFPGWSEGKGESLPVGTTSNWTGGTYAYTTGHPFGTAARVYMYTTSYREWIVGPRIKISANTLLHFDVAASTTSGTAASMGSDDSLIVRLSTDCGKSFFNFKSITAADNIDLAGKHFIFDLGGYAGQNVIVAFFATSGTVLNSPSYYLSLDNILIYNKPATDLSLETLVSPNVLQCYGEQTPVAVVLRNAGYSPISFATNPATIKLKVMGPATDSASLVVNIGTLQPDSVLNLSLGTIGMGPSGLYSVNAVVTAVGDGFALNDSVNVSVNNLPNVELPVANNFTGFTGSNLTTVFPNWYEATGAILPSGTSSNWTSTNFGNLAGANGIAALINFTTTTKRDWIVGPKFNATIFTRLSYAVALTPTSGTTPTVMGTDDKFQVMISTNCGGSFFPIKTYNAASNLQPAGQTDTLNLATYAGKEVIVAFFADEGTIDDGSYYFFLDNILIENNLPNDLEVAKILSDGGSCKGTDSLQVVAVIENNGTLPANNFLVTAKLGAPINATLSTIYTGTLATNQTDTVTFMQKFATNNIDSVLVTVKAVLAGDGVPANDSASATAKYFTVPTLLSVSNDTTICQSQSLALKATSTSNVAWYDASMNPLASGSIFNIDSVNQTQKVYVAAQLGTSVTQNFGPASYAIGAASATTLTNHGNFFVVSQPVNLKSVRIFSTSAAGSIFEVNIRDGHSATGTILKTKSFTITGSASGDVLELNELLQPGNYTLTRGVGSTANAYRNSSGAVYPYEIPGLISIIGHTFTGYPDYYYYFYDVVVGGGSAGCVGTPDSVLVTMSPKPAAATIAQTGTTELSATPAGASKYLWQRNGLTIADTTQVITVPAINAFYSVSAVSAFGCVGPASAQFQYVVTAVQPSTDALNNVYPNPSKGLFNIEMSGTQAQNVTLLVHDNIGRLVVQKQVAKPAGSTTTQIDLSALPKGIYTLNLVTQGNVYVERLVIE